MQPINRVNFEIPKFEDSSDKSTYDQAINLTLDWLKTRTFIDDAGTVLDLTEATPEKVVGAGALVESMVYEEGERKAWGVRFSHPDGVIPSLRWIDEITVSDKGGPQIFFSNTLGISQTDERVAPVEVMPSNPTLNREILSTLKGQTRHKHRLFPKPHVLNPDSASIDIFVRIVENKDRSHPLVLVTSGANNIPLVNPEALARSLAGMAHVLVAASHATALQVSNALPTGLGCQNGGIRIYWPDFHKNKDPQSHNLFLDWEVVKFGEKLPGKLVEIISRQAVLRMPEDYISWTELQTACLRQSIKNGNKAGDALELLAMFETENGRLQQDLTSANATIAKLRETLGKFRQQVAQFGVTLQEIGTDESGKSTGFSSEYGELAPQEPDPQASEEASPKIDAEEAPTDESEADGGLPFYDSAYLSHASKQLYNERQAHPKGVSTNPPPPSGKQKPEIVVMKGGYHARPRDWFYDDNFQYGIIIQIYTGHYYGDSTDDHKVWLFNDGKYSIVNGFKLKGPGIRLVKASEVPEEAIHLYNSLEIDS